METPPRRFVTNDDYRHRRPIYAVWEITLACNLRCTHCGSRAGRPRPRELSLAEALEVVAQLARLGVREVTLIGGETYLRHDWLDIVKAIRDYGMGCSMQTGGRGLTEDKVRSAVEAGLTSCGVSLDGLPALHDELRGVPGSFECLMEMDGNGVRSCNHTYTVKPRGKMRGAVDGPWAETPMCNV